MPKVREILCRVCVETAEHARKCHRNKSHSIRRGERHLAIYESTTSARKNYCQECARPILARAAEDLREIEAVLYRD